MFKGRRRNLHWGDLNMTELELEKLILHFEQSNKAEGKSPKTITWYTEMIADDHAVDVAARLDARLTLQGYPHKFVGIAYKQYAGYPLTNDERSYLYRHRRKVQKRLILA